MKSPGLVRDQIFKLFHRVTLLSTQGRADCKTTNKKEVKFGSWIGIVMLPWSGSYDSKQTNRFFGEVLEYAAIEPGTQFHTTVIDTFIYLNVLFSTINYFSKQSFTIAIINQSTCKVSIAECDIRAQSNCSNPKLKISTLKL